MEPDIKINLYTKVARHVHNTIPALCMMNNAVVVLEYEYFESLSMHS